jgi:hypothetical protein
MREKCEEQSAKQLDNFKDLRGAVKKLHAENSSMTVRMCELESWVEEQDGDQTDSKGDEAEVPVGLTPEQATGVRASREAANSNSLKACHSSCAVLGYSGNAHLFWQTCVTQVTAHLQGIATCAPHHLRTYDPELADELSEKDAVTGAIHMRFDFNALYDDHHNHACISKIVEFVKSPGATHLPAAAASITAISDANLLRRVQEKFRLMKKQYQERQRLLTAAAAAAEAEAEAQRQENEWSDDEGNQLAQGQQLAQKHTVKPVKTGTSAAKLQSRGIGVCKSLACMELY